MTDTPTRHLRPSNFEFAMDFIGDPEAEQVRAYVDALELQIDRLRAAVTALAALVQRDRVALYQAHAHPVTGAVDEAGQSGLDEYDAALRLADEAMGNDVERAA